MPRLALARGYATQPQQAAKPDYGNPITKGLVSLANFGVAHPLGRAWDAVTNTPWGQTGTTGSRVTNKGRGLLLSGNGSLTNLGFTPSAKITGPWTVFMLVASSASGTAVVCSPATQSAPYCACFSGVWSISNTVNGSVSANGTMQAVAFRQFATTADVTVNGVKGTSTSQNYAAWASGVGYLADFGSGGGFPLVGSLTLHAMFNRALTDNEIQALARNPWQLFRAPASPLEKSLNAVSNVYGVSVAEVLSAVDMPNRDGGANYSDTVPEMGTAADAPSAAAAFGVAATETLSGVDTASLPGSMPTVTVLQYWLKSYLDSTHASPQLQSGYSNPCTVTAGTTLVAVSAGWDASRQIPLITDDVGTFTTPSDTGGTSCISHPNQMTVGMSTQANAAGGAHTISVPTINDGTNGQNGELGIWVIQLTNMPSTLTVHDVFVAHRTSASNNWTATSDASPVIGDVVVVVGTMENSSPIGASGVSTPSGYTQIALNDDGTFFIPTEIAWKQVTTSGVQTATWTATDPTKTEDFALMLILAPSSGGSGTSASMSESGTASDALGATEVAAVAAAENGTASDVPSVGATSTQALAESGTAADAPAVALVAAPAIAESGTAADAASLAMVTPQAVAEAGAAAENADGTNTTPQAVSEAGIAGDVISNGGLTAAATAESGAIADSGAASMVTPQSVAESGGASDAMPAAMIGTLLAQEAAAAADAPSALAGGVLAVVDLGSASDSPAASATFRPTVAEIGGAADAQATSGLTSSSLTEAGTAADVVVNQGGIAAGIQESGVAAEVIDGFTAFLGLMLDALAAADGAAAVLVAATAIGEAGAAADSAVAGALATEEVTETVDANDVMTLLFLAWVTAGGGDVWYVDSRAVIAIDAGRAAATAVDHRNTSA